MNLLLPYRLAAGLGALLLAGSSLAETLRVGTSGDYAPFSVVSEEPTTTYRGLAPALARAFAEDRDLQIEFVRFRWSELLT
ncbi:MAG: transporter substrate-binding domain-containing protein, partial [Myxococcota bacterium]